MAEHLDANLLAHRTTDVLAHDFLVDMLHLVHVQLTCQDRNIRKASIKLQSLGIGDVQLSGEMHFLSHLIAIAHHSHITGDDCRDASLLGSIDDFLHRGNVVVIDDGIDSEIGLDAMLIASSSNLTQVVDGEMIGRVRTHVQLADAEIDRVCSSLDGSRQRLT